MRLISPSSVHKISIGSKISTFCARLLSSLDRGHHNGEQDSTDSERSKSRGREGFTSTGRGGIGNIRQASLSRDARPSSGPDDFSATRGREPVSHPAKVFSTGRGGVGNLRSPSRDPANAPVVDAAEQEVIREYVAAHENTVYSSGRGGIGNINRSRSREPASNIDRSRSRDPHVHSSGRGGAGNIHPGDGSVAETIDEDERRNSSTSHDGPHSTGRGGVANITSTHEPSVEHNTHPTHDFLSTGRGGAGNIISERSRSRS